MEKMDKVKSRKTLKVLKMEVDAIPVFSRDCMEIAIRNSGISNN